MERNNIMMESDKIMKLFSENSYHTSISCDDIERLKKIFYSGDVLISNDSKTSQVEFEEMSNRWLENSKEEFFEGFHDSILDVVGKKNALKCGGGFGKNCFHFSYYFKKKTFWEKINRLKQYFDYLEISDIMSFIDVTDDDIEYGKRNIYFQNYKIQ